MDLFEQPGDGGTFQAWLRQQTPARLDSDILAYTRPAMSAILTMTSGPSADGQTLTELAHLNAYVKVSMVVATFAQSEIREPDPITLSGVVREIHVPDQLDIGGVFSAEMGHLLRAGWKVISDSERAS